MGRGRKKTTLALKKKTESGPTVNSSPSARNLRKADLGAVIFGCKHHTHQECLSKQLFGLPASHISYVRNISIGLPLFLFNYSDRKLHGVFEAASPGQLNIDPYGWTSSEGTEITSYAAQVRVRVRKMYHPLTENQFSSIIGKNYYAEKYFWFELDQSQTKRLLDLFSSLPALHGCASLQNPSNLDNSFKSLPMSGPTDAVDNIKDWDWEERSDHLDHGGWVDAPTLMNSDTTRKLDCGRSYASMLGSTSTSTLEPKAYSQKSWSSLFKPSACDMDKTDATSEMNKIDPMLSSSSSRSSPLPDKHRTDWELCLVSSVDKDGHNYDAWGSEEDEEPVERQYDEQESEHSDLTVSELNRHQLNALESDFSSLWGESHHLESSIDSDNVEVPDNGPTSLMGLKEEGILSQPFSVSNSGSEERRSEVLDTSKHSDLLVAVTKLIGEVEELKRTKLEQDLKIMSLEQELVNSKMELQQFSSEINKPLVIVGGFNGSSWLPSVDSYFLFHDHLETLAPLTFSRAHASTVKLSGELFVLGGVHGGVWFNTVESYNPMRNRWMQQPSLCEKKGSLAGASLCDKIFAIGGGNGVQCFSEVEMLDLNIGKWIFAPSMMQKRFALAAADINGAIYAVGGYDREAYLKSAERFDPRERAWATIGSMKTRRGCHSLVAYDEKLYALGGFDGNNMVSSVEILDPRFGSWVVGEQMSTPRGYSGAVVIGGKLCVIGGVNDHEEVLDTVEYYKEGHGWQMTNSKNLGKRCFFSAIVL